MDWEANVDPENSRQNEGDQVKSGDHCVSAVRLHELLLVGRTLGCVAETDMEETQAEGWNQRTHLVQQVAGCHVSLSHRNAGASIVDDLGSDSNSHGNCE